jgi:lipoyl(octanoyl) transferase
VTFHGPGQLVGYPILDLRPDRCDLRRYVRNLAEIMTLIARDHGIEAGTVDGLVGVWVDKENYSQWATAPWASHLAKLGAIGVRVSRWVTMHGFALNLDVDLDWFRLIVPCGISQHPVTSVADLLGKPSRGTRAVALGLDRHLTWALEQPVHPVVDLEGTADAELSAVLRSRLAAVEPPVGPPDPHVPREVA